MIRMLFALSLWTKISQLTNNKNFGSQQGLANMSEVGTRRIRYCRQYLAQTDSSSAMAAVSVEVL